MSYKNEDNENISVFKSSMENYNGKIGNTLSIWE